MTDNVSAGELRAWGVTLPEEIPDVAVVPRSALEWRSMGEDTKGSREFAVEIILKINASFKWVVIDIEVPDGIPLRPRGL